MSNEREVKTKKLMAPHRDLFTLAAPFAIEQWKKDMLVIPFWEELEKGR